MWDRQIVETDNAFAEIFGRKPEWLAEVVGWEAPAGPFREVGPATFKAAVHGDLLLVPADPAQAEMVCEFQFYYDRSVWARADLARLLRWRQTNPPEACRRRDFVPREVEAFILFGDSSHVPPGAAEFPGIRWASLSERLAALEARQPGHVLAALLRPVAADAEEQVEVRAARDFRQIRNAPGISDADRDCLERIFVQFLLQRFRNRTPGAINAMIGEFIPVEETRTGRELIERGVDEVLFVLLERVCGALDQARRARIEALPVARAKELALALLDFHAMADLDAWLDARGQAGG